MNVTDGRTDIGRHQKPRLRMASRGKNKQSNRVFSAGFGGTGALQLSF